LSDYYTEIHEKGQCIMGKRQEERVARILRERRSALGLTQGQVATEAGIEMRAYQRYEHGKSHLSGATMKVGLRICAALELDPFALVFDSGKDMAGVERRKREKNSGVPFSTKKVNKTQTR
jgi:transcriptional regulator with XRE-family HTH domain